MKRRIWSKLKSKSLTRALPWPLGGGHPASFAFVLLALISLGFSVASPQGVSGIRTGVSDALMPVLAAVTKPVQGAAMFVRNVSGLSEMQAENERLRQENIRLREWYQSALLLEAENKSLRNLLNVKPEPQHSYVSARILADSGSTFMKSLLVDAGREDGVAKGQLVISGEGVVGRVVEAGRRTARILLITDINSRVPVLIEDSSQHAILAGQNDDMPVLVHLPPDSEISEGARIITSGHGGVFPRGMPVGRVVPAADGAYHVELFADFSHMVYVRMVKTPDDANLVTGSLD